MRKTAKSESFRRVLVILVALILTASALMVVAPVVQTVSAASNDAQASSAAAPLNGSSVSASNRLPNIFPKSNRTNNLYVVRVGGDTALGYTIAALQGLVARNKPQLYLVTSSGDTTWLHYTATTYGVTYQYITEEQALLNYQSYVERNGFVRIILYDSNDPIAPTQLDMAKTLSGVYDALPVSTAELPTIQSIYGASNIKIIYNLSGRFTDKITAYTWLWDLVQDKVTNKFLAILPNATVGLTDYVVENKAFSFEFSGAANLTQAEANFTSSILSAYPSMTPVIGFFGLGGEGNTITFLSEHELTMVPSEYVPNLSFFSGLPTPRNLQPVPPANNMTYSPEKTYVLFSFTQGDGLGQYFYYGRTLWNQTDSSGRFLRAEIPTAWQIDPMVAELAPQLITYYYSSMFANDSFYTSASGGAGYAHPDQLPNLTEYLAEAKPLAGNLGLSIDFLVTGTKHKSVESIYQQYVTDVSPTAIFIKHPQGEPPMEVSGVPVMSVTLLPNKSKTFTSADVKAMASEIRTTAETAQFIFIFLPALNPGLTFVQAVAAALGPNFVPVRADQFASLYQDSLARPRMIVASPAPLLMVAALPWLSSEAILGLLKKKPKPPA